MKYRIIFEGTNEQLFKVIFKEIDDKLKELGVPPKISDKTTKSSYTVRIDSPLDGRRKLENIKDNEGNIDLDNVYPHRSRE